MRWILMVLVLFCGYFCHGACEGILGSEVLLIQTKYSYRIVTIDYEDRGWAYLKGGGCVFKRDAVAEVENYNGISKGSIVTLHPAVGILQKAKVLRAFRNGYLQVEPLHNGYYAKGYVTLVEPNNYY